MRQILEIHELKLHWGRFHSSKPTFYTKRKSSIIAFIGNYALGTF